MKKKSISTIIMSGIIVLLTISIGALIVSFISMQSALSATREFSNYIIPIMDNSTVITEEIGNMRLNSRSFMFDNLESSYQKSVNSMDGALRSANVIGLFAGRNERAKQISTYTGSMISGVETYKKLLGDTRSSSAELSSIIAALKVSVTDFNVVTQDYLTYLSQSQISASKAMNSAAFISYLTRTNAVTGNLNTASNLNSEALVIIVEATARRNLQMLASAVPVTESLDSLLVLIGNSSTSPQEKSFTDKLKSIHERNKVHMADVENLLKTIAKQVADRGVIGESVNNNLGALNQFASSIATDSSDGLSNFMEYVKLIIVGSIIVLIAVGLATVIVIRRKVTNKLKEFVDVVANFTEGDGDLTRRIPFTGWDEIGRLGVNFNKFVENIHHIIMEVKLAAEDVVTGNYELAATMGELSSTFASQSEQVSSVANNMETMNNTSKMVVASLADNITKMQNTSGTVSTGSKQLDDVMGTVATIKDQTGELASTITNLNTSSNKIGDILSVINDIADQTNLLALNAAIEAARAGDMGRGFAVVADEVRKLAERTQNSTSEISNIIINLQKESEMASVKMGDAEKSVDIGMSSITKTSDIFLTVVDSVSDIKQSTQHVNSSVNDQFHMMQTVNDNTQVLASGIEESTHAIKEVSATVSHLQQRGEKLKLIVGKFKL